MSVYLFMYMLYIGYFLRFIGGRMIEYVFYPLKIL